MKYHSRGDLIQMGIPKNTITSALSRRIISPRKRKGRYLYTDADSRVLIKFAEQQKQRRNILAEYPEPNRGSDRSSVARYAAEQLRVSEERFRFPDLYSHYRDWCLRHQLRPFSAPAFRSKLNEIMPLTHVGHWWRGVLWAA